jgi:hypothetical protein
LETKSLLKPLREFGGCLVGAPGKVMFAGPSFHCMKRLQNAFIGGSLSRKRVCKAAERSRWSGGWGGDLLNMFGLFEHLV